MLNALQKTQTVLIQNFKNDKVLIDQIFELTAPSYVNTIDLLSREIHHNRDIYITKDENNTLLAYFMINYETVAGLDTCYLGLSACRESHKGQGLVKKLYQQLIDDCKALELTENRKILLWWTTATPVVYHWFNKHINRVEPNTQGRYTTEGKNLVLTIIKEKYPETTVDAVHPFILRSAATNTNYSEKEKERLKKITKELLEVDVFEKYNVVETNGDRFLMIGYTPD